jgi:hypothetical protein
MTNRPEPRVSIQINALDPDTAALWETVAKVANTLGEDVSWCLVGGLMVALFAIEAEQLPRPTTDIDILGNARQRPSAAEQVTERLKSIGGTLHQRGGLESERGFRFYVDGQIVDVLAPEGLPKNRPPITTGNLQTIQIPGGTQALQRTELVEIVVNGRAATLRRPTLIAAILLKTRALRVHSRPDDQRHDLVTLLGLLDDPRTARDRLSKSEIGWLRNIETLLHLDDPQLADTFDPPRLQAARAAYQLLVASS